MKDFKRRLAIVLAACMVLTNVMPAFAEETAEIPAVGNEIVGGKITETELDAATPEEALYEDAEIENDDIEEITPSDGDIEEASPSEAYAFIREAVVDGVRITLTADAGVFPENAELYAVKIEDDETKEAIDEAVEAARKKDKNLKNAKVLSSLKFDIKIVLPDGTELQPEGNKVKVKFTLAEKIGDCVDVNVYHLKEVENGAAAADTAESNVDLKAEKVEGTVKTVPAEETADTAEGTKTVKITSEEVDEDGVLADGPVTNDVNVVTEFEGDTDGFSYYTVEFTYEELQYVLDGDNSIPLSDILAQLKIEGIVTAAEVSNEELFTVEKDAEGDDWTVTALQAFSSEEWLKVTIDGKEYTIIVTDTGGFTTWEEFRLALLNAENGAILKLTQNLEAGETDRNLNNPQGKTVTIDLNGFTLDRNGGDPVPGEWINKPVIDMPYSYTEKSKLIIVDSSVKKTGTITGGNSTNYGAGISVNNPVHTLIIRGGKITGNKCSNLGEGWPYASGIGVASGTLIMDGGSVTGNTIICKAGDDGGMVLGGAVAFSESGAESMIIGGNAVIKDNIWKDPSGSTTKSLDLRINKNNKLTIGNGENGCSAPENGMEIGAFLCDAPTTRCSGAFTTNGLSDYVKYFFADYSDQYVKFEDGHLELAEIPYGSHKINIGSFENGSVTSDKQFATPSDTVTLTVSPDTGYHLTADTLKVTYNDGSIQVPLTKVDDTQYTFAMPEYPVTVTAEFEEMIQTWAELQTEINNATAGATITLTRDLTASPSNTCIYVNKDITLDLNGHTLDRGLTTAKTDGNVIRVGEGVSLTIKNGTITGSHPNNGLGKGALRCEGTTELNLINVKFDECKNVALYIIGVNSTNIVDCTFYGNTYGGGNVGGAAIDVGIRNKQQKIMIEGCRFENNVITGGSGSAIHLFEDCDMTIKDSTFTGNHAGSVESEDDGGVICAYKGSLTLDGCTIRGNTAAAEPYNNHCGGVSVSKDVKSFIIKGKTIIADNTCGGKAADLSLQNEGAIFKVEDLKPESKIGVMTVYDIEKGASAVIGENATDDDLQYFFADNPDYSLKCEDGKLILTNGANNPNPKKRESSSGTYSLFTGTWNNPVSNGKWTLDANGIWHYATTATFRNTWGYIYNPYARAGQHEADWFYFDNAGNMLIGWQLIGGKWYYLNPFQDGTGTLGACLIGPGKTPDGYEIDDQGAWTGR